MSLSVFRRIWQRFLKPTHFVGKDLEGNKYYECPNANDGRTRRTVKYRSNHDMWTYIASGKRLPVQWNAWLTHTRPNPPSIQELQADLARRRRVEMNAAILEARDKEERERVARLNQTSSPLQIPDARLCEEEHGYRDSGKQQGARPADVRSKEPPVRDPWAEAKRGSDEPEAWTPVTRRRSE